MPYKIVNSLFTITDSDFKLTFCGKHEFLKLIN